MRIVTRPDFDGVVCAVLLYDALAVSAPVKWVQPNDIQREDADIRAGDIIANLPFHAHCSLWFDHHYSNRIDSPFEGMFKLAPSAARVIFEYYQGRFHRDYRELVAATDKIDSADLSLEEIQTPENFPYILLSMTFKGGMESETGYWNHVVDLLRKKSINDVRKDSQVDSHCRSVIEINQRYKTQLRQHTTLHEHVSLTDFRGLAHVPEGNRYLVYSIFPQSTVNVKIYFDKDRTVVKVGHSVINRGCKVNVGKLLAAFNGGGHRGAGAGRFPKDHTEKDLAYILKVLARNEPND
jgi:hypothetical protein